MDRFIVRWREDDRATWKSSSVMSKANADDNALFLNAYGYTAKVCVAE